MNSLPPSRIRTLQGVARILGCGADDLQGIAGEADQRHLYERLRIPKKNRRRRGQFRTVYKPNQRLALIQKNIGTWLAEHVELPEYVQGFVQKRSIATNARLHLGQAVLLHADIQDFFDSITVGQVTAAFIALGCAPPIAETLGRCCTLNGRLPQGSSASPILANLVCRHLDVDLNTLATANGCRYSRYADDITVSGDIVPEPSEMKAAIERHGFALRDDRCRIQKRGRSQYVTGLSVFDSEMPRIPRQMKHRLRLELHYATKFGLAEHLDRIGSDEEPLHALARLHGWMSFIYSVEGTAQGKLFEQWLKVSAEMSGNVVTEGDYYDPREY
jgi:retron-type reverse transcriptase